MATAKQIAAQKRFAEMARSGKLARLRKKAGKRAVKRPVKRTSANPAPRKTVVYRVVRVREDGTAGAVVGMFYKKSDAVKAAQAFADMDNLQYGVVAGREYV